MCRGGSGSDGCGGFGTIAHVTTVLRAFSVFMLPVAESLPETSAFVPLLREW